MEIKELVKKAAEVVTLSLAVSCSTAVDKQKIQSQPLNYNCPPGYRLVEGLPSETAISKLFRAVGHTDDIWKQKACLSGQFPTVEAAKKACEANCWESIDQMTDVTHDKVCKLFYTVGGNLFGGGNSNIPYWSCFDTTPSYDTTPDHDK